MSSTSTSPSPESNSSNRSDWFRQSVLFWSSQSERSNSEVEDSSTALPNLDEKTRKEDDTGDNQSVKPKRRILEDFDPSDLLRQVEELERCFKKSTSEVSIADETYRSTSSGSPHLTLEFPSGSSIKDNPIFKAERMSRRKKHPPHVAKKPVRDTKKTVVDNLELTNEKTSDKDDGESVIANIQKVQHTLSEISKEIEISSAESRSASRTDQTSEEEEKAEPKETENESGNKVLSNGDLEKEEKVELEEIEKKELSKDNEMNDEDGEDRDPNQVMRDWLSNIRPPPPMPLLDIPVDGDDGCVQEEKECEMEAVEDLQETPRNGGVDMLLSEVSTQKQKHVLTHEELFEKIDQLIDFEHQNENNFPLSSRSYSNKQSTIRDRLDSGLQSVSSDSMSPYPSPNTKRSMQKPSKTNIIHEVLHESVDHVFRDDSDFSDWSPISTLESNTTVSGHRPRSHSISYSPRTPRTIQMMNGHTKNIRSQSVTHEMATIEKFLSLTNRYLDKDGVSSFKSTISLDDLAILPNIRETINQHRKELEEQRKKQEDFLHQLGDLLLEVVTIKEEHSTVRTKQTKALNLLKKQLDAHKKTQSQAHTDVVNKVKSLNEKITTSFSFSTEQLASSPHITPTKGFVFSDPATSPHQGHIIWKITDVMKKLARIKTGNMEGTVVSPSFQTGEYGYRINGWLYLNGRGKMTGKYLSLYVCVLVGDYDAILKWPIQPSYTMTLIDQNGDLDKRRDHVKIRRVIDIAGRGSNVISQCGGIPRPNDCTKALIVGFDDFISHEQLLERRYLSDDTLFIKIEASVS